MWVGGWGIKGKKKKKKKKRKEKRGYDDDFLTINDTFITNFPFFFLHFLLPN